MLHGVFQLTSSCYSREFFPGFFGFIDQCPVSASSRALFIDPIRVSFLGRASIICPLTIKVQFTYGNVYYQELLTLSVA